MPVIREGSYRKWAPTAQDVLTVMLEKGEPISLKELRWELWILQKNKARIGEQTYYVSYKAMKAVIESLLKDADVKKVRNSKGWPKYLPREGIQAHT